MGNGAVLAKPIRIKKGKSMNKTTIGISILVVLITAFAAATLNAGSGAHSSLSFAADKGGSVSVVTNVTGSYVIDGGHKHIAVWNGQRIVLSAVTSGFNGPVSYSWVQGPGSYCPGFVPATTPSITYIANINGANCNIRVYATGTNGKGDYQETMITVLNNPTITVSPSNIGAGSNVIVTASFRLPSTGNPSFVGERNEDLFYYVWTWSGVNCPSISQPYVSTSINPISSSSIRYQLANGGQCKFNVAISQPWDRSGPNQDDLAGYGSASASLPIFSTSLAASLTLISAGQIVTLTNTTSGGTGALNFSYNVTPTTGVIVNGSSFNFTTPGNYLVKLNVKDQANHTATSSVNITVTPPLFVTSFVASTKLISAGQSVHFTNTTIGGTGANVYTYIVNGVPTNVLNNTIKFTTPNLYRVEFIVTDISGEVSNKVETLKITVTPRLNVTNFTAQPNPISAGQSVSFNNVTSGGTGNNVYSYLVNGAPASVNSDGTITFPSVGTYNVTLGVTDTSGENANASTLIRVTPVLTTHLTANKTTASLSSGSSVLLTNTTSGGTGSNVYSYVVSPGSGFAISNNIISFSATGIYNVTLNVQDQSLEEANSTVAINVTA